MSRPLACILLLLTGLAGCTVERTPEEFREDRFPATQELERNRDELRSRLAAFGAAMGRGNVEEAVAALDVAADAFVIGAGGADAPDNTPSAADALAEMLESATGPVGLLDSRVIVSPRGEVGWYGLELDLDSDVRPPAMGRITGLFMRTEGRWRTVQLHLSRAAPAIPPEDPEADEEFE